MTNRRCSNRIAVKKKIMLGVFDSYFFAQTLNISESGIAIQSEYLFPPKSKISVQLYTGSEIIKLDGVVVWVLKNIMGIKLLKTIHDYNKHPVH